MKEHNKETLRKAIEKLPQHRAPSSVWEGIETQLSASPRITRSPFVLFWGVVASLFFFLAIGYFLSIRTPNTPPTRIEAEQALDSSHALEPVIETYIDTLSTFGDSSLKE